MNSRRHLIATQQEAVIRALAEDRPPAGFEQTRMRTASGVLREKRWRRVARRLPVTCAEAGAAVRECFDAYAKRHPLRPQDGPDDARDFGHDLRKHPELSDRAVAEIVAHLTSRGFPVRIQRLPHCGRWCIFLRVLGRVHAIGLPERSPTDT